ncbi:MAG TPA: CoA transferase, partial [Mycobacteriales bacterium]|nr:CoA transferase [Mycobacteriales bacterium]
GLLAGANAVVWSAGSALAALPEFQPEAISTSAPDALVLMLTPFGFGISPDRPVNEFILQALGGGWCGRGVPDRAPLAVGGDFGEWIVGVFGAVGILTAHQRPGPGSGELIDVSGLDTMQLTQTMFAPTFSAASGRSYRARRVRTIPLIHPTQDGYVGFQVTTGQQWQDFCSMIGRDEWREDPTLTRFDARISRYDEINSAVDGWTSVRPTAEVVDLAVAFRIPVAPVGTGATIPQFEQCAERGWFVKNPRSGFLQPDVHYTLTGGARRRPFTPAPQLGEDTAALRERLPQAEQRPPRPGKTDLPFDGLRIADFTAFWAGPIISHHFAMFGADVIHVESTQRPDGIRAATLRYEMGEGWWEASPTFAGTNTNKRDLTLDMRSERGRELARELVARSDVVVENYSSRVMPHWGMDYEELRRIRPDLIMVRAPAFGIAGPWEHRVGYATTIEQACGAASITGFADDRPDCAGGSFDPVAGMHAVFALLLALEYRDRTGQGLLVEVPQFTAGLQVCAEQFIEYSSNGRLLARDGNRSWTLAPQGVYRVADAERDLADLPPDEWIAISVPTDEQWLALCRAMGNGALAADPALRTVAGRRQAHDLIDTAIESWTRDQDGAVVERTLREAGVPAAVLVQPHALPGIPEVTARGSYEMVDNPVLGTVPIVASPIRLERGPHRHHRRRAPLLGEHNQQILQDLLGLTPAQIAALEADSVIGTQAATATAW